MNREDIDRLVEQIRYIILNKPISDDLKSESEELADLQEAVFYLSNCLAEANEFLKHLRNGELEAKPPSRHNFLAGNLKELHSALKHLTWQADRVAHGDYSQSVNFLGEFSRSFNEMIRQLAEREAQLKEQSTMLTETAGLMKSIMNGLKEWIIVTTQDSGEIIYTNRSAQQFFLRNQSAEEKCSGFQDLLDYITHYKQSNSENCVFEYECDVRKKTFRIHSYAIRWSEKMAYVHFITDVTSEKEYREQIEGLAYMDELTGLYNRRFCLENLERLIEAGAEFTFCMVDIDGLKYANDHFGHAAGDKYLCTVAQEMLRTSRATDLVCRIGGDEFAVLFSDCKAPVALRKMEELDRNLMAASEEFPMSISYGVVHVTGEGNISPQMVMQQADAKMYILKNIKKAARASEDGLIMAFAWTREMETGNAQIDAEHKELIQACNNLLAACAAGTGKEKLSQTVDFLKQYAQTHFRHEEGLQIESGYPDYENHKKYHEALMNMVDDLSNRLKIEGPTLQLMGEINKQLGIWLINHIKTEDTKVARHIQAWEGHGDGH